MRRILFLFLCGMLLCFGTAARAQDHSGTMAGVAGQNAQRPPDGCRDLFQASLQARQVLEQDRHALETPNITGNFQQSNGQGPARINLSQDLKAVDQSESEFESCDPQAGEPAGQTMQKSCSTEQILQFQMNHEGDQEREISILRLPGDTAFFYEAGMTIDADGAPNAYHPDNIGLDDLVNAGAPGHWEGLAKDDFGEPYVQGPDDPFPGYYVSETALTDRSKAPNDPARYVDATRIPYVVLPGMTARGIGMRPGDLAVVFNLRNGQSSYAIFGDVGPFDRIGEGSIALARNLGIHSDARNGGARRGIVYLLFPGSGNGWPKTVEEINAQADRLLQAWGGIAQLSNCMQPATVPQIAIATEAN